MLQSCPVDQGELNLHLTTMLLQSSVFLCDPRDKKFTLCAWQSANHPHTDRASPSVSVVLSLTGEFLRYNVGVGALEVVLHFFSILLCFNKN